MCEFTPLKQTDYAAVKHLFQEAFDLNEDKFLMPAWKGRREDASLGYWRGSTLLAAAVVRGHCLEYIFVSDVCRGGGIGTQLLQTLLSISPALHLTPVNDLRVIRWYESQGFRLSRIRGVQQIYAHVPYALRSRQTIDAVAPSQPRQ
jgi:GNAT superfamily N-acetyltransferase